MSTIEHNGLMIFKDAEGNKYILYPVTQRENILGMEDINEHLEDKTNPHEVTAEQIKRINGQTVETALLENEEASKEFAKKEDIPTTLPNPNQLIFTGAIEATYDGSSEKTIEIPVIAGEKGEDGTSVTIVDISESTKDGGSNVITFSDGKTVTVKNGSKGNTGEKGDTGAQGPQGEKGDAGEDGTSVTIEDISESNEDEGENVVAFSDGNILIVKNGSKGSTGAQGPAGQDGYTPVKGSDYFTDEDKEEIVDLVFASLPIWNGGSY